ncbi:MAG: hypothetical protein M3H12_13975, partial [Chromatiales bacterium]
VYRSRIRGPYVRFCERDEAVTPHPTRCQFPKTERIRAFVADQFDGSGDQRAMQIPVVVCFA